MTLQSQIEVGLRMRPRRVMLYGAPGIGLSTFAASAEKPIFIPTVDGHGHIGCDRFPRARSLSQVLKALRDLAESDHRYRNVVIDTFEGLETLIWDEVCRERNLDNISDMSLGKGYLLAMDCWRQVLDALDTLGNERGMTCMLLGHAHTERIGDQTAGGRARQAPSLHWRASAAVMAWCDEVLYAAHEGEGKSGSDAAASAQSQKRVLMTAPSPTHVAKNHLGLKAQMPMRFDAFAPYFNCTPKEICGEN